MFESASSWDGITDTIKTSKNYQITAQQQVSSTYNQKYALKKITIFLHK